MTGVGLVAVGIGTDEVWEAIRWPVRAASARITQFDASAFACQIAGEVKDFDPADFIEKKEIKKMGAVHPFRHRGGRIRPAHGRA